MKHRENLTGKLLDFFRRKEGEPLNEFIKTYPERARSIYTIVDRLEKTGFLAKSRLWHGHRLQNFFRLTEKGKEKLKAVADRPPATTKEAWDGLWRLLIFDIPEERKAIRELLRQELKRRGFYMMQLSVWVTPFEVDRDLLDLIEEIAARPYVRLMVVKEVDDEKDMLIFFGL